MENENEDLRLHVTTKPKRGATGKEYEITSMEDMFTTVNKQNYKRFLKDLKLAMELLFVIQGSVDAYVSAQEKTETELPIMYKNFKWIDD